MSTRARIEDYSPGEYGLPHMGEVIADHRIKAGWTSQESFAIVCGVDKQTVAYWENQVYLTDMKRRILLCKVLKIPPALLGLTWASLIDSDETNLFSRIHDMSELLQENAYALYEDILLFARTIPNKYAPETAYRFYKHQQELENIITKAPKVEKGQWTDLLCRYYQHSTFIAQNRKDDGRALLYADKALELAIALQDVELITGSRYRHARICLIQKHHEQAKQDIDVALQEAKQSPTSHRGSISLLAAEIYALSAGADEKLQIRCRKWQDAALNLVYKERNDENGTRIMFNVYAVHHEKAKTLLRFCLPHDSDEELVALLKQPQTHVNKGILTDAEGELILAHKHLESKGTIYAQQLALTEAKYYLLSQEWEESARRGKAALHIAQQQSSQQAVEEVKQFYILLHQLHPTIPHVVHLGVELGIFPD